MLVTITMLVITNDNDSISKVTDPVVVCPELCEDLPEGEHPEAAHVVPHHGLPGQGDRLVGELAVHHHHLGLYVLQLGEDPRLGTAVSPAHVYCGQLT